MGRRRRRTAGHHPMTGRPARLLATACAAALALLAVLPAAPAQALPAGAYWYTALDLQKAWKYSKGAGVTVAVIDSGVQTSVGDLRGQTVPGIDLTGNDPGADTEEPEPGTGNYGHGTDMAVKIAGNGHGAGMVGIAPEAKILPIDAGGSRGITSSLGAKGIMLAVDRGAKVINLSVGGVGACPEDEAEAIQYAYQHNVIVVASAGDDPGPVNAPANCPGALAIGGVDAKFNPWTQTPSGPEIDFVAPAYDLVDENLDNTLSGPYPGNDGTSSSAAFTSGIFALLWSRYPHDTARQIVTRALYNVHNGLGQHSFGTRINNKLGYGMILPFYALTNPPPANFDNPIYDRFAHYLGPATPTPKHSASRTSRAPAPTATTTSTSTPAAAASTDSSGSGLPTWGIALIAIAAALALTTTLTLLARRNHNQPPPAPPAPGPPAPPPPYGYRP